MVDDDGVVPDRCGKVLFVIDIQSGDIIQRVRFDLPNPVGRVTAILVDGDEIFVADSNVSRVVVLRYAGAEA